MLKVEWVKGCARFVGWLSVALSLLVVGLSGSARAQSLPSGVSFGPTPGWVKTLDMQGIKPPEASGGVEFVAFDTQAHIVRGQEATFVRTLLHVTAELGTKALGEQRFVFTPPHQTLVL